MTMVEDYDNVCVGRKAVLESLDDVSRHQFPVACIIFLLIYSGLKKDILMKWMIWLVREAHREGVLSYGAHSILHAVGKSEENVKCG